MPDYDHLPPSTRQPTCERVTRVTASPDPVVEEAPQPASWLRAARDAVTDLLERPLRWLDNALTLGEEDL